MKVHYRISHWRFNVSLATYSEPTFEGETIEVCDTQALAHFEMLSNKPENEWDGMNISRIDTPAVAEKTTFLKTNGRQSSDND
jgi:hypothetical protein